MKPNARAATTLFLLALTVAAGCPQAPRAVAPPANLALQEHAVYSPDQLSGVQPAPEFPTGAQWLNTDHPVTLKELRGKVVLLDFWTYCCINCMHVIPDLKKLEQQYPDALVVIGVHSAKFNNEQQTGNIRNAVLRYEIEHPVVNDASMSIWNAYNVHSWPTFVLIDPEGKVIGAAAGEGVYDRFAGLIGAIIDAHDKKHEIKRSELHWVLERDHAPQSELAFPGKLEADEAGKRLFISDSNHNRIVIAGLDGKIQDTIGSGTEGLKDGSFAEAQFHRPQGLAYDKAANLLYVADTENHALRQVDLARKTVTTLAGDGTQASQGEVGPRLSSPWDLVKVGGTLYIAMAGTHQLWAYDIATKALRVHAGNSREDLHNGPLLASSLAQPSGIATDGKGLYFADSEVSAVRRADVDSKGVVTTLVGHGLFDFADTDGDWKTARLQHCIGVDYHNGAVYVADTYNHKVKRLDLAKQTAETIVGTGQPGQSDGSGAQAMLAEPNDVAWLDGVMYIADTNNSLIRTYDPQTQQVGTFALQGLATMGGTMPATATANRVVELTEQPLPLNGGTVRISFHLPDGTHLNELQDPIFKGDTGHPAVHFGTPRLDAEDRLSIPVKIDKVAIGRFHTLAKIDLAVFFCDLAGAGQCYLDNVTLDLPLDIGGEGAALADVNFEVKMP